MQAAANASSPNFILITIDALRSDHLGCYGYRHETSPVLDGLARRGALFDQAITPGCWTSAAFPGILTSTHASLLGGCTGPLSSQRPALSEILQQSGYNTAAVQTSPLLGRDRRYDRGFGCYQELCPSEPEHRWHSYKGVQRLLRQPATHWVLRPLGIDGHPAPPYVSADRVTDRLLEQLGCLERPFFVWAHYMDVHHPYVSCERSREPSDLAQAWRRRRLIWKASRQENHPGDSALRDIVSAYDEAIRYVDRQLGRLLNMLDRTGLLPSTILAITSDHGEEFFDHGCFGHAHKQLYEEIVRVPLIVVGPGFPPGSRIAAQVSLIDLAPTLLDAAQVERPEKSGQVLGMEGHSFLPLLWGHTATLPPVPAITEAAWTRLHKVSIRQGGFKYIVDLWQSASPQAWHRELYDLEADPQESRNLAGESQQHADVLAYFEGLLRSHLARVRASQPEFRTGSTDLPGAVVDRLRALGYVD